MGVNRPTPTGAHYTQPAYDTLLRRLIESRLFFAPWVGDTKTELVKNSDGTIHRKIVSTSGKIIERCNAFGGENTDTAVVPLSLPLEEEPLTGNAYFEGTGEKLQFEWMQCYINQIGKVVEKDCGKMEKIRSEKILKLLKIARPRLVEYMVKWMNSEFVSALYDGHSMNVTKGTTIAPEGIGANRVFHPNLYINAVNASSGAGDIIPIGSEYHNKTVAEIQASRLVTGDQPTAPSPEFLTALGEKLDDIGIRKAATYDGVNYWLAVIDRATYRKFKHHTEFRKDVQKAFTSKEYKSPLFGREAIIFDEFMFVLDDRVPRAWDNTTEDFAGTGNYIKKATSTGSRDHRIINILGPAALGWAPVVPFETRLKGYNFDLNSELLALTIFGICRPEYVSESDRTTYFAKGNVNTTTLNTAVKVTNQSSLQVAVAI